MKPGTWSSVFLVYWYGVLCTAQAGKMPPLVPDLERALGVPATTIGLCVSAVVIVPALAALPAGWVMERLIGLRRSLGLSALVICLANIGEAFASTFTSMLALRVFEGIGFVGLLVGSPALIIRTVEGKRRVQAMAGWSVILGLGFVFGLEVAAPFAGGTHYRRAFVAFAVLAALSVIAAALLPADQRRSEDRAAAPSVAQPKSPAGVFAILRSGRMLRVGASFGAQQIVDFGGGSVAPVFFMLAYGVSAAQAAAAYAVSMFIRPIGGTVIAFLLGRGVKASRLAIVAACLVILCGDLVFSKSTGFWTASGVVIGFNVGIGAFSAITMALLSTSGQAEAASSSAIVNQLATVGSFAGPPLFFAALQSGAWIAFAALLAIFCFLAAALLPIWGASSTLDSAAAPAQGPH